jgi:hypothetical protein
MATPMQDRWEEVQYQLWTLTIKERQADLAERRALLRLLIGVTIAALLIAFIGAMTGHPLAGLGASGALSTTAMVFAGRHRRRLESRRRAHARD